VTVSRVLNGDTVEISPTISGTEDVRLIGVDTPEPVDPLERKSSPTVQKPLPSPYAVRHAGELQPWSKSEHG
jgi:endonuclease YncB( thermonuclease family)